MAPPLADLLQIVGGGGAVVGAAVGFAFRAESDREMLENVVLGAGLGGVAGSIVAFVMSLVARTAGA
jgi:hypothetical protein